jgi:hypothetical protein
MLTKLVRYAWKQDLAFGMSTWVGPNPETGLLGVSTTFVWSLLTRQQQVDDNQKITAPITAPAMNVRANMANLFFMMAGLVVRHLICIFV